MEIEAPPLRPVLKWAGGKRQLLARIAPLVPEDPELYVEPFVGAGAVLLACRPARARVNDLNPELVGVWLAVRDEPRALLACLREHARLDSEAHYYEVRALDRGPGLARLSPAERAARAVYLNKTCFNGLWRVNSRGQFNVPYGRYSRPDIVNEAGVMALSAYLRKNRIEITCGDYAAVLRGLPRGAFAYLDPPYAPGEAGPSFTGYTPGGFGWAEQVRLRGECEGLRERGVRFLLSNADTPAVRELYEGFEVTAVPARRSISRDGSGRGPVGELLVAG